MGCVPESYTLDYRFEYALVHFPHAETFADEWICRMSNEEKAAYKWEIKKMREFLSYQKY